MDANLVSYQVAWSIVIVWVMKAAKSSDHPALAWITEHTHTLNRVIAVLASGAVALGLHWRLSYNGAADNGTVAIVLTGLSWSSLAGHARDWVLSYAVQQTAYRATE